MDIQLHNRPDTNSARAYFIDMVKGHDDYRGKADTLAGVNAKDDYTSTELECNFTFYLFCVQYFQASQDDVEKWGGLYLHPWVRPFVSEWTQGDKLVLSRNENYWRNDSSGNSLPYLDGMELKVINDLTMQWTEFNLGNFEAIEVVDDPYYHEALEKYPDSFFRRPMMGTYFYGMNVTAKPFDNKKVRQA